MRIDPILAHFNRPRVARLLRKVAWLVPRALTRRLRLGWATLRRLWRRSLQFRVVATTLLVSVTLVAAFGVTVAKLITDKVLDSKSNVSRDYVKKGAAAAVVQLGGFAQSDDPSLLKALPAVLANLATTVDPSNNVYVVILRTRGPSNFTRDKAAWPTATAYDEMTSPAMAKLRAAVSGAKGNKSG